MFNLSAGVYQYRVRAFEQVAWEVEGNIVVLANQNLKIYEKGNKKSKEKKSDIVEEVVMEGGI